MQLIQYAGLKGGAGGVGTLYKRQYKDVPLTWVRFSAIFLHSWVAYSHIFSEFQQFLCRPTDGPKFTHFC